MGQVLRGVAEGDPPRGVGAVGEEEAVPLGREAHGAAVDLEPPPVAVLAGAALGLELLDGADLVHVVGDVEVEPAVPVDVGPAGGGGHVAVPAGHARREGDVGEAAAAVVAEEMVGPEHPDEGVGVAVPVVVGRGPAVGDAGDVDAGSLRDVGEPHPAVVAEEARAGVGVGGRVHEVAVGEEDVHVPVPVVVEEDRAAALGLGDPLLVHGESGVVHGPEAGGVPVEVGEGHLHRRGGGEGGGGGGPGGDGRTVLPAAGDTRHEARAEECGRSQGNPRAQGSGGGDRGTSGIRFLTAVKGGDRFHCLKRYPGRTHRQEAHALQ